MTNTNTEWEKRFDDDYELGGGFRDLQIMLRGRKGIEKGFAAHIRLIKDFIRTEKEKSYQEGRIDVLKDFDDVCCADAFMGFSDSEWSAIKRFFKLNKELSQWDKSVSPTNTV